MAVWCFTRLLKMLELMSTAARRDLTERVRLTDDEVVLWEDMTRRMTVPFHGDSIISQFTGYDDLLEFDWPGYREKYGDIHRLDRILEAEGDSPNRYKLSKQADVTMLFFLLPDQQLIEMLECLGYDFSLDHIRRNIEYYLARTSHGSTLSRVVHAALLARIDPDGAWPLFRAALTADQTDAQGGTTKGRHPPRRHGRHDRHRGAQLPRHRAAAQPTPHQPTHAARDPSPAPGRELPPPLVRPDLRRRPSGRRAGSRWGGTRNSRHQ